MTNTQRVVRSSTWRDAQLLAGNRETTGIFHTSWCVSFPELPIKSYRFGKNSIVQICNTTFKPSLQIVDSGRYGSHFKPSISWSWLRLKEWIMLHWIGLVLSPWGIAQSKTNVFQDVVWRWQDVEWLWRTLDPYLNPTPKINVEEIIISNVPSIELDANLLNVNSLKSVITCSTNGNGSTNATFLSIGTTVGAWMRPRATSYQR